MISSQRQPSSRSSKAAFRLTLFAALGLDQLEELRFDPDCLTDVAGEGLDNEFDPSDLVETSYVEGLAETPFERCPRAQLMISGWQIGRESY